MKTTKQRIMDLVHFAVPVVYPIKGETILKYKTLIKDPTTKYIWLAIFGNEFGNLAQGNTKTNT